MKMTLFHSKRPVTVNAVLPQNHLNHVKVYDKGTGNDISI